MEIHKFWFWALPPLPTVVPLLFELLKPLMALLEKLGICKQVALESMCANKCIKAWYQPCRYRYAKLLVYSRYTGIRELMEDNAWPLQCSNLTSARLGYKAQLTRAWRKSLGVSQH